MHNSRFPRVQTLYILPEEIYTFLQGRVAIFLNSMARFERKNTWKYMYTSMLSFRNEKKREEKQTPTCGRSETLGPGNGVICEGISDEDFHGQIE